MYETDICEDYSTVHCTFKRNFTSDIFFIQASPVTKSHGSKIYMRFAPYLVSCLKQLTLESGQDIVLFTLTSYLHAC